MTPRSLGLRVSRPNALADIVLYAAGRTDVAVLRPDADAVARETVDVDSIAGFGSLLDRVVELITWSGARTDPEHSAPDLPPHPLQAAHWVLGFNGLPWPIELG